MGEPAHDRLRERKAFRRPRGEDPLAVAAERAYTDLIEKLSSLGAGLDSESARRLAGNAERRGWTDVVEILRRVPARPERS